MKEQTLLKIAITTSVIGLIALFFLSDSITITESDIDKITIDNKDEYIKLKGTVTNIVDKDTITIVTIKQPKETTAILFKPSTEQTKLQQGQQVEILGKVDEYNGQLQIIGHRARIIE